VTEESRPDDQTRSHVWEETDASAGPRVFAFWDGGFASHALPATGTVTAGRALECEVRIDHPSVSRAHVRVHGGAMLRVEDLGSSNGTRVGGQRIPAHQLVPITPGEMVEIGSAMIVVQSAGTSPPARPVQGVPQATVAPPARGGAPQEGPMDRLKRLIDLVASGNLSVIVLGETGVGKDVTATLIHQRSRRAQGPLIKLNCAAFTDTLLESELFGYERGAFTGAVKAKPGLLETGSGGTVFLDEVGEMPLSTQVKLLRVLENREVTRLGSVTPRRIDVRFVAATNRDLSALVASGAFRQDLFFRLNGIAITIPPLRQRPEEILPLATSFLADECARAGHAPPASLSPHARAALLAYGWPGNIRELKNVIERAFVLSSGGTIEPEHLMFDAALPGPGTTAGTDTTLRGDVAGFERERIILALERSNGNQTQAAKVLGISRRTLVSRLGEYDIPRPRKGREEDE